MTRNVGGYLGNTPEWTYSYLPGAWHVQDVYSRQRNLLWRPGLPGLAPENPAVNGIQIRDAGGETGWYWIQTSLMPAPLPVFVNNDDQGGGWMLAGYKSGTNSNFIPNAFTLSAPLSSFTLNLQFSCDVHALWFHNGEPQCNSTMQMASAGTPVAPEPLLANSSIARKVIYTNPEVLTKIFVGSPNATPLLAGTWYPIKGFSNWPSNYPIDASNNWHVATSYWGDCRSTTNLLPLDSYVITTSTTIYGLFNSASNQYTYITPQMFALYIR